MAAYSMDVRGGVAAARDNGMETAEVAEVFGCCRSWVRRLMQRRRELGTLAPIQRRQGEQRSLNDADEERVRQLIAARPDMTLVELAAALGCKTSESTMSRVLKRLGLP